MTLRRFVVTALIVVLYVGCGGEDSTKRRAAAGSPAVPANLVTQRDLDKTKRGRPSAPCSNGFRPSSTVTPTASAA